jgi:hypothetical protein
MKSACTVQQWQEGGQFLKAFHKEQTIFFRDEGQGPALVLIHGFPTSSYDWSYIWKGLGGYRRIAPDLIGFGFSDKPVDYHYSISDQANLIERLLDRLEIQEYHILAHDYGDTVAQELLARNLGPPERDGKDHSEPAILGGRQSSSSNSVNVPSERWTLSGSTQATVHSEVAHQSTGLPCIAPHYAEKVQCQLQRNLWGVHTAIEGRATVVLGTDKA